MKGDFTRFTFQPAKHYTRVFMQQGRLQLDSDWNEQMDIQTYLNLCQAQHMIGAVAGTPSKGILKDGFKITATPDGSDLIIHHGQFYVGGLLCELIKGSDVTATYLAPDILQLPFLEIDGQPFAERQWIQVGLKPYLITKINPDDQTLTLSESIKDFSSSQLNKSVTIFRLTTYLTQPDYPNPKPLVADQSYLVYLDVWQRHITAIEDPDIREIALADIPDTTTRVKTIWQVKLADIDSNDSSNLTVSTGIDSIEKTQTWGKITRSRPVSLTAQVKPLANGLIDPRIDNQLYRVEIHTGGTLDQARFKWSRDNGTVVSAIKEIRPQENAIVLLKPARDTSQSFSAGQWVEISDELRELTNQPGTLVRLKDVVIRTEDKLIFDPATVNGDPIDDKHFPQHQRPKIRRWDWTQNEPRGLSVAIDGKFDWVELENGIQVKFDLKPDSTSETTFETGDYWLIPTRMNPLKPILWPQDNAKTPNPLPQPPQGIYHQFGLLAFVSSSVPKEPDYWDQADKRTTFPPLINCFDKNGDSFTGPLGIGVKPPLAQLHVKGTSASVSKNVTVSTQGTQSPVILRKVDTGFQEDLFPGDVITITPPSGTPQTRTVTKVDSNQITIDQAFDTAFSDASLTYQHPVLRLDTSKNEDNPQLLLNATGNVGIGTISPTAKLDVRGTFKVGISKDVKQGFVQVEAQKDLPVKFTSNQGYSFDQTITIDSGNLGVSNGLIQLGTTQSFQLERSSTQIRFITTKEFTGGYSFDKGITINSGNLVVSDGLVKIGSSSFLQIEPQKDKPVKLTSNAGYLFDQSITIASGPLTLGTDSNNVQLALEGNQVRFTTSEDSYSFNKGITLTSGNLTVSNGFVKIGSSNFLQIQPQENAPVKLTSSGGYLFDQSITIASGSLKLGTDSSNVQLTLDTNQAGFITSKSSYSFDKAVVLNQGITIASGSLTLGTDSNESKNNVKLTLVGDQAQFTTTKGSYSFDKKASVNDIDVKGQISFSSADMVIKIINGKQNPPKKAVCISGQSIIGKNYSVDNQFPISENGLLVEGDLGVGTPDPKAKLHVVGAVDSNKNPQEIVRIAANNGTTLLSIKPEKVKDGNDVITFTGNVNIAPQLRINGTLVTASSRQIKQNISELSSQEVDEILRGLNPVKFIYRSDAAQVLHLGFISEDVPEVLASADKQAISPVDIVATLTRAVKDHRQVIVSLNKLVKEQQKTIAALTERLDAVEGSMKKLI